MNLKQLEAFAKVAEMGSFSKAAKTLYLTQPTISAHISGLEKELDVRLFVRNTKEVALSQAGKELYVYARQILDLTEEIEDHFGHKPEEEKHVLTIAASTIPAQFILPDILMKFKEKYPDEQFKLIETDSAGVVEQIVSMAADVGFTGTVLEKKHCCYTPFYKDRLVIITPNTEKYQKLAEAGDADISWIEKEQIILREEGSGTRKEAEKQLKVNDIDLKKLNIVAEIENQETIKRSVRQGMGISILSELATRDEVEDGYLLALPIPHADEGRDLNLIYNKNVRLAKHIERFIRLVRGVYHL